MLLRLRTLRAVQHQAVGASVAVDVPAQPEQAQEIPLRADGNAVVVAPPDGRPQLRQAVLDVHHRRVARVIQIRHGRIKRDVDLIVPSRQSDRSSLSVQRGVQREQRLAGASRGIVPGDGVSLPDEQRLAVREHALRRVAGAPFLGSVVIRLDESMTALGPARTLIHGVADHADGSLVAVVRKPAALWCAGPPGRTLRRVLLDIRIRRHLVMQFERRRGDDLPAIIAGRNPQAVLVLQIPGFGVVAGLAGRLCEEVANSSALGVFDHHGRLAIARQGVRNRDGQWRFRRARRRGNWSFAEVRQCRELADHRGSSLAWVRLQDHELERPRRHRGERDRAFCFVLRLLPGDFFEPHSPPVLVRGESGVGAVAAFECEQEKLIGVGEQPHSRECLRRIPDQREPRRIHAADRLSDVLALGVRSRALPDAAVNHAARVHTEWPDVGLCDGVGREVEQPAPEQIPAADCGRFGRTRLRA